MAPSTVGFNIHCARRDTIHPDSVVTEWYEGLGWRLAREEELIALGLKPITYFDHQSPAAPYVVRWTEPRGTERDSRVAAAGSAE